MDKGGAIPPNLFHKENKMSKITVMPQTARFTSCWTIDQTTLGYQVTYGLTPKQPEDGGQDSRAEVKTSTLDDPKSCTD